MYRRNPTGDYLVGVCTNTLCAIMGGDAILEALQDHLDIHAGETTEDGRVTLEHIECNAACDYAPVVMVNWEFFDNQTPSSARDIVDGLRSGTPPEPTRGAPLCTFRETARTLAGLGRTAGRRGSGRRRHPRRSARRARARHDGARADRRRVTGHPPVPPGPPPSRTPWRPPATNPRPRRRPPCPPNPIPPKPTPRATESDA